MVGGIKKLRITEMAGIKGQEEEKSPYATLDFTPDTLNTMSDEELDTLREAVHEIWRMRGSKENDEEAIGASIVINNEYKLRKRELPKKDKLRQLGYFFEGGKADVRLARKKMDKGNRCYCSVCLSSI